tara:strand:+ start:1018 stop:1551 length:534 start_codon:yes stop_codon:yes gene_type:complete
MAAGNTLDIRTHVMGDMLMLTGTFTDGGKDVSYDGLLTTVFAAGGHVTSIHNTGVLVDNGSGVNAGEASIDVDTVDARLAFNEGDTVYKSTGAIIGTCAAVTNVRITIEEIDGTAVALTNNEALYKHGPYQVGVTLNDTNLAVSIDETNLKVVFGNGTLGANAASTQDGRWWILGQR